MRVQGRKMATFVGILLLILGSMIAFTASPVTAEASGYPYASYNGPGSNAAQSYWTDANGNPYSPYHYNYRNCTDYVAWKLATVNGWNANVSMGNAVNWWSWANDSRHKYTTDTTPAVGSVAYWAAATWNFQAGHVAYVESVNKNTSGAIVSVTVSEYNFSTTGSYDTRTIAIGSSTTPPSGYIHFKDTATPQSPPDSDGDGVIDANDACPHVYAADATGCPGKNDFSLDGKSDVAAFYNYGGGLTNLWIWNGQNGTTVSSPYSPWSQTTGFDATRLAPAGTSDFNGDKMQDTAAFYTYDNGGLGLDIWYGNPQAGLNPYQAWYVGSGWEGARLIPAGVGDFNGDGKADVAAFYRYDGYVVNLYMWYGQTNGSMSGPYTIWTGNGWDGTRVISAGVGDLDGDGHADISTFYAHDGGMVDQNVWYGDGAGNFTLGRPWHVDSGWDGTRIIPAGVADLNGDGKADTIAFFRHDNYLVDMRVWYGTSNRIGAADPSGPWSGNGWDGSRIIPAGTGDFNGDGKMDIAAFYRYDGQVVGMNIWYGSGTGNLAIAQAWYDAINGWEGARIIPPAKG